MVLQYIVNRSGTVPVFSTGMPLFLNSGMNTAIEDESGKDAALFHTSYSRLRHPFPIV